MGLHFTPIRRVSRMFVIMQDATLYNKAFWALLWGKARAYKIFYPYKIICQCNERSLYHHVARCNVAALENPKWICSVKRVHDVPIVFLK